MMTLMERLVAEGYPKEEFFHHYSDCPLPAKIDRKKVKKTE